jgi:hypothetical protein
VTVSELEYDLDLSHGTILSDYSGVRLTQVSCEMVTASILGKPQAAKNG